MSRPKDLYAGTAIAVLNARRKRLSDKPAKIIAH